MVPYLKTNVYFGRVSLSSWNKKCFRQKA